jgi:acyl-coenzyme A synthetase/AMP-(fatty) acid ligase
MLGVSMGLEQFPVRPGSAGKPVAGYEIDILTEEGEVLPAGKEGFVVIKLPLPPGCLTTLWNDFDGFKKSYLSHFEGYYQTGDGGYKDDDGYTYITGRIDDVINVSGHRLSTAEMEEIVASLEAVVECAVLGVSDELRGQRPVAFVVLKDGYKPQESMLEAELVQLVRQKIGAVAFFKTAIILKRLPKTRSGKILRKTIRKIADKESYVVPSTIDDPVILQEIEQECLRREI